MMHDLNFMVHLNGKPDLKKIKLRKNYVLVTLRV